MNNSVTPPIAEKQPYEMIKHNDVRVDDYYWMRLTDDQKKAENYDEKTQKVVDYINNENIYTQESLKHTNKFQDKLFDEIVGRIKKDDESVPYFSNGYFYYTKYEPGKEYAINCRKKGTLDSDEEIILDQNILADGKDYFAVGGWSVSPNNEWLAYSTDYVSRRIYTVHFKNLLTGETIQNAISNSSGSVAWANDNRTVFYTSKNDVTLLSEKIWRHKLGSDSKSDEMVYHEKDDTFYSGVYLSLIHI